MQLSTALLLCILILGLTGGLTPLQALFQIKPFHAIYFAVCMLAFSAFTIVPSTQLRFSLHTVMLPLFLSLWAWHERPNPGAPAALLVFSLAAFFAGRAELFAGVHNGLLTGCIAGAAATVLVETPRTAGCDQLCTSDLYPGGRVRQFGDWKLWNAGFCQRSLSGRPD